MTYLYSLCKTLINDCLEKVSMNEIFTTTNSIPPQIINNSKSLAEMDNKDKELVIKSLENISLYSKDFSQLRVEYLLKYNSNVNLDSFRTFIRTHKDGYYYKKAIFLFIVRCLFILSHFLIIYRMNYPVYICVDKPIDNTDKMFWIYNNIQYKVITEKINKQWYLRMISAIYDCSFMISEGCVLWNLRRMKANACLILTIQILKYFNNGLLIVLDFSKEICEKSKNDGDIFYKKNYVLELEIINIIYDIIKNFIN
jgi:hypothetical protein